MENISQETVCYIIIKAHEFDAKVDPVEPDPGSNPADDGVREILSDYKDDPTFEEFEAALKNLNADEMVELMALVWLGRGDYSKAEWDRALAQARETCDENAVRYLTGIPLLGDYLEEALAQFDRSCEEYEIGRL